MASIRIINRINRRLVHEYKNDFKIDVNLCGKDYASINPFLPIPGIHVLFDFKAFYENIVLIGGGVGLSVFRLKLEKLYGFNINPTLELYGKIFIFYNNKCIFKEYKTNSFVNVEKMSSIYFEDVVSKTNGFSDSDHVKNMGSGPLNLKCELFFYLDISTSGSCRRETTVPKKYIEDFKSFFKSDALSDVMFNIGEKTIPAHKVILAAHSPVLMTMMTQDFLESKTNRIEITDCAYEIFEKFLKYLYFRKIEDKSYATVIELNILADKYDVSSLKIECAEILVSQMSVNNICQILKNAYDYNNDVLKIPAIEFASVHFHELRAKDEWICLVRSHALLCYKVVEKLIPKV